MKVSVNCISHLKICNKIQVIKMVKQFNRILMILLLACFFAHPAVSQNLEDDKIIDEKVKKFLQSHRYQWRDMNVPTADGQKLYDLIIENKYKKALEIGTSTGHSGIWIAWALSKTGGKLITVEISERRHKEAMENFKEVGLSEYIDARLADAHELVPKLKGPFDFVFSDADKNWYKNYFMAVDPKLEVDGCYVTHNVSARRRGRRYGGGESYLDFLLGLSNYETTVYQAGAGMSISLKESNN